MSHPLFSISYFVGRLSSAIALNQRALELYRQHEDKRGIVACHNNLSTLLDRQCSFAAALDNARMALALLADESIESRRERASCLLNVGNIYLSKGAFDDALASFDKAKTLSEQLYGGVGHVRVAKCDFGRALALRSKQLVSEAEAALDQALAAFVKTQCNDDDVADCYNTHGQWCKERGAYAEALALHMKALELATRSGDVLRQATARYDMANLRVTQGQYDAAHAQFVELRALYATLFGSESVRVADCRGSIGNVLCLQGRLADAEREYEAALALYRRLLPPQHKAIADAYGSLGNVHSRQGRYVRALLEQQCALAIDERVFGADSVPASNDCNNIGLLHYYRGDYVSARQYHERALRIRCARLGEWHWLVAQSYENDGIVLRAQARLGDAQRAFERSVVVAERMQLCALTASALGNLAGVLHDLGEYSAAAERYKQAQQAYEQSIGTSAFDAAAALRSRLLCRLLAHELDDVDRSNMRRLIDADRSALRRATPSEAASFAFALNAHRELLRLVSRCLPSANDDNGAARVALWRDEAQCLFDVPNDIVQSTALECVSLADTANASTCSSIGRLLTSFRSSSSSLPMKNDMLLRLDRFANVDESSFLDLLYARSLVRTELVVVYIVDSRCCIAATI
jgi:tetratricopeptide (TPR) repeat protein